MEVLPLKWDERSILEIIERRPRTQSDLPPRPKNPLRFPQEHVVYDRQQTIVDDTLDFRNFHGSRLQIPVM